MPSLAKADQRQECAATHDIEGKNLAQQMGLQDEASNASHKQG
jgi:hypothetical protein